MSSAFTIFCIHIYIYVHICIAVSPKEHEVMKFYTLSTIYNFHNCLASHFDFGSLVRASLGKEKSEGLRGCIFPCAFFSHRSPHGNCWTGLFGWHCVLMQRDGKQIIPWPMTYMHLKWIGKGRWRMALRCGKRTIQYLQSDCISEQRKNKQQT